MNLPISQMRRLGTERQSHCSLSKDCLLHGHVSSSKKSALWAQADPSNDLKGKMHPKDKVKLLRLLSAHTTTEWDPNGGQ